MKYLPALKGYTVSGLKEPCGLGGRPQGTGGITLNLIDGLTEYEMRNMLINLACTAPEAFERELLGVSEDRKIISPEMGIRIMQTRREQRQARLRGEAAS